MTQILTNESKSRFILSRENSCVIVTVGPFGLIHHFPFAYKKPDKEVLFPSSSEEFKNALDSVFATVIDEMEYGTKS